MAQRISQKRPTNVPAPPSVTSAVSHSPLYKLPFELRSKIYGFVLQRTANANADQKIFDDGIIPICLPRCPRVFGEKWFGERDRPRFCVCRGCFRELSPRSPLTACTHISKNLLRVCRLIDDEACPLLYQLNSFALCSTPHKVLDRLKDASMIPQRPLPDRIGFNRSYLRFLRRLTIFNEDNIGWYFNKAVIESILALEELQVLRLVSARRKDSIPLRSRSNDRRDLLVFGAHVVAYHPLLSNLYYVEAEDYMLTEVPNIYGSKRVYPFTLYHRDVRYTSLESSLREELVEWCKVDPIRTFHYAILTRALHVELVRE